MDKKILFVFIIVFCLALLLLIVSYAFLSEKQGTKIATVNGFNFTTDSVMEIVKTDKDYNDALSIIKDFAPELVNQIKLGPTEYQKLKPQWEKEGSDMAGISQVIDAINLNDSTYLVSIQNKNDKTKGLLAVIDTNTKKSLAVIATIKIEAGVGI